ncbi:Eukaryotic translation initiation factor 2D [Ceratobasidium theobromae]|uniref:Eukaryotic translation initiation factor 2D n=1 Tax=Ceratobasidium theobromae TaxID=1582974 RepID=A0A5N5QIR1_9AGAM|nr:Eukaryotic translation initiation factor 2D [Ceratobasidium theobromae]
MFKKPPHKMFNSAPLRNSDIKILRQRVLALFPSAEAMVDELVPKGIMTCKFDTHLDDTGVLYSAADKEPLWFAMGKGGIPQSNLIPTGGADLMIPGVVPSPILATLAQGQLVSITRYRNNVPIVVGSMAINGSELKDSEDQKGKAVVALHAAGDALWALGSKSDPPQENQPNDTPEEDGVAEVIDGVQDIKVEDGAGEEASAEAPVEARLPTVQEVETTLRSTTLYALARLDSATLPLPASTFYSSHILPSRPARPTLPPGTEIGQPLDPKTFLSHLDIKHTSYKKLASFLKTFEKDGIIKLKEVRGELLVFSVDSEHPALVDAGKWGWKTVGAEDKKEREREKGTEAGGQGKEILVEEVWFPEANTEGFFEACGESAPHYTLASLRPLLSKYITTHNLQHPSIPKYVVLDDVLSRALLGKGEEKEFVGRDELVDRLSKNMKAMKGPLPQIAVQTKTRQGRKVVTLVTGFEPFGLDPEVLSEELRKRCASSTSVAPCPEKPKQLEVMVQGNQIKAVVSLLLELGVPKKWITTAEKTSKGKGGK